MFSKISGLTLNKDNCTVLKLGSLRNSHINLCNDKHFNWTSDQATTLGIIFTNNSNEMLNANFNPKKEVEQCLHKWSRWKLSILGKNTESVAVPKFIYPLTVLNNPDQVCINKIKKLIFQFLLDKKNEKNSRDKITQDYCLNGLQMLD